MLKSFFKKKEQTIPKFFPFVEVSFYKDKDCWYADLPGVNKDDCLMIEGSHKFLEAYSNYLKRKGLRNYTSFTLKIYELNMFFRNRMRYVSRLEYVGSDEEGYIYRHHNGKDTKFNTELYDSGLRDNELGLFYIWLCDCLNIVYKTPPKTMIIV